jgi:hypothetical protein
MGLFLGPTQPQISKKAIRAHMPFPSAGGLPGPWRGIEIEVAPHEVRVWWRQPDGTLAQLTRRPAELLRGDDAEFLDHLNQKVPGHGVGLPDWSPRMPIGIWNERAAIALRNVSITPL